MSSNFSMVGKKVNTKIKNIKRPHLIKGVSDSDWNAFRSILDEHNKTAEKKISMRTFFKLMNTYSPLIKSLITLDPDNSPIQQLGVNTAISYAPRWINNIGNNVTRIKKEKDIRELRGSIKGKSAIIIGAGESLHNNASGTDHIQLIKEYSEMFDGVIILADRVLEECLQAGIGDYFTVVDGSDKILPFFDNDTVKRLNETRNNQSVLLTPENIVLPKMKGIMATCTHPSVVNSWNGDIYFLVASIPNEILPNCTRFMCDITETSDISAGGNCGMLAWNIAMWMGCTSVALVGMDYSYKVTTPLEQTGNWQMFMKLGDPEKAKQCYHKEINPYYNIPYIIDDVYISFKQVALNWITAYNNHGQQTYNCTEGGAIFGTMNGSEIKQMLLKDFLEGKR